MVLVNDKSSETNEDWFRAFKRPVYHKRTSESSTNVRIKDKSALKEFTHPYYHRKLPVARSQTVSRRLPNNPMLLISTFSSSSLLKKSFFSLFLWDFHIEKTLFVLYETFPLVFYFTNNNNNVTFSCVTWKISL